jgi:NAD(P)-dependent dehydrogenase (short-subunit alcohol dehydrogenase family)
MPQGFNPDGRVVVVTGAGSGIGRALAVQAAVGGARAVVACDIDQGAAQETADLLPVGDHHAIGVDVRDETAVAATIAHIEERIGPVDLWCSNAGVHRGDGLGADADWDTSLDVHLRAHVYLARHLIPRMADRGQGWLLISASAAGLLSDIGSAPYTASKHAAVGFAEWLSINYDTSGITVSCLCPQGVKTGMNMGRRDGSTGSGDSYLEPGKVAADAFEALQTGLFLILPHPDVASYEWRRSQDRERWLAGMRRLSKALNSARALHADRREHRDDTADC